MPNLGLYHVCIAMLGAATTVVHYRVCVRVAVLVVDAVFFSWWILHLWSLENSYQCCLQKCKTDIFEYIGVSLQKLVQPRLSLAFMSIHFLNFVIPAIYLLTISAFSRLVHNDRKIRRV